MCNTPLRRPSAIVLLALATLAGCASDPYPPGDQLAEVVRQPSQGAESPQAVFEGALRAHQTRDAGVYFDVLSDGTRALVLKLSVSAFAMRMHTLDREGGNSGETAFLELLASCGAPDETLELWRTLHESPNADALAELYQAVGLGVTDIRRFYVGCMRLLELQRSVYRELDLDDPGDPYSLFLTRGWTVEREEPAEASVVLHLAQQEGELTRTITAHEVAGAWRLATNTVRHIDTFGRGEDELRRLRKRVQ